MQRVKWISWLVGGLILAGCGRQAAAPAQQEAAPPTEAATVAATVTAPADTPTAEAAAGPTATPVAQSPAAAAAAPISPLPTVTPSQATQPAGADDASFAEPDWYAFAKTYTDEQVGFELRYPADWTLLDISSEVRENSTNYAVTINSWESSEGGGGGIPEGQTKLDILVERSDATTVQEAADLRRSRVAESDPNAQIVDEAMWELADGLQAQRWTIQGQQGDSYEVIAVFDGWTVTLSGLGDAQRFEEVARTLRPLAE